MIFSVFSGAVEYDSMADLSFKSSFSVSGDTISVFLTLFPGSEEIELDYEGDVYKSFRYTSEDPVYIGVFEDGCAVTSQADSQTDVYKIIYFEISNGSSLYSLDTALRNSAAITLYLQSNDGTIYDLSKSLSTPIILSDVELQAPSENDMTWFLNYFNGEYAEEKSVPSRSSYNSTWAGDVHSLTYQIAGYEHKFMATPYIDFVYGDVASAGDTSFGMSLKISESHRYRPIGASSWTINSGEYSRCFIIDNVQLTWTAGGNTVIKYVCPHLLTPQQEGEVPNIVGLAATVAGISPQTATLSTLLSVADPILGLFTGYETSFNTTNQGGMLPNSARAYKFKFPDDAYIETSSYGDSSTNVERFEFVAFMATSNSNLSERYWTYAIADAYCVISWADITGQSGYREYEIYKELGYYNNY